MSKSPGLLIRAISLCSERSENVKGAADESCRWLYGLYTVAANEQYVHLLYAWKTCMAYCLLCAILYSAMCLSSASISSHNLTFDFFLDALFELTAKVKTFYF